MMKVKTLQYIGQARQYYLRHPHELAVFLLCFAASFVLRFPFLFLATEPFTNQALAFHDEGIYLLAGRDVLEGHLPYTHHWDNRLPLNWLVYALLYAIGGGNLTAIRFIGIVWVSLTAFIVYLTGRRAYSVQAGLLACIFYTVYASNLQGGQSLLSDHIFALPFALLLHRLFKPRLGERDALVAGGLFAACCLILPNALALFPAVTLPFFRHRLGDVLAVLRAPLLLANWRAFYTRCRHEIDCKLLVLGVLLLSYCLLWLLYSVSGNGALFLSSTMSAFIDSTSLHQGGWDSVSERLGRLVFFVHSYFSYPHLLIGMLLAGFVLVWHRALTRREDYAVQDTLLMAFLLLSVIALLVRGRLFPYELLQFLPLICLLMARGAMRLSQLLSSIVGLFIILGLLFSLTPIAPYYKAIGQRLTNVRSVKPAFYSDFEYKLADIINKRRGTNKNASLYVCGDLHVLHILTHTRFIPYLYHSNLARSQAMYDRLDIPMRYPAQYNAVIAAAKPDYLVLFETPYCRSFFRVLSPDNYDWIGIVGDARVYKVKEPGPRKR